MSHVSAPQWSRDSGEKLCEVFGEVFRRREDKKQNKPKQQALRATSEAVPGNADKLVWQVGMEVLGADFTGDTSLLVLCQVRQNASGHASWADFLCHLLLCLDSRSFSLSILLCCCVYTNMGVFRNITGRHKSHSSKSGRASLYRTMNGCLPALFCSKTTKDYFVAKNFCFLQTCLSMPKLLKTLQRVCA